MPFGHDASLVADATRHRYDEDRPRARSTRRSLDAQASGDAASPLTPVPDEEQAYLKRISPTPLLMVVAPNDRLVAGELASEAYETAAHPKKLVLVPGGHFDAYVGRGFEISSGAARDWFVEHLLTAARVPATA